MKWQYEGIDQNGNIQDDIVEASGFKEVVKICISKGLYPKDIRQLSSETARNYSQIHRLKKLKNKIESNSNQSTETVTFGGMVEDKIEEPKPKWDIDWTYVSFVVIIIVTLTIGILI